MIELEPVPTRFKVIAFLMGMALGASLMLAILARQHHSEPPPVKQPTVQMPWLYAPDNACHPKTLADMFIPCDTKDSK
jgi:hypothetical protein